MVIKYQLYPFNQNLAFWYDNMPSDNPVAPRGQTSILGAKLTPGAKLITWGQVNPWRPS
jgi:hypothetical protein